MLKLYFWTATVLIGIMLAVASEEGVIPASDDVPVPVFRFVDPEEQEYAETVIDSHVQTENSSRNEIRSDRMVCQKSRKQFIYCIFFKFTIFTIFQADMQPAESQLLAQHHYALANQYQYDQGAAEDRIESQYKTIDPDSDFYIQRLTAIRNQIDEELQMYALRQQQRQEIIKLQAEQIDIENRDTAIEKRALRNEIGPFQNDPMAMGYRNPYPPQAQPEYTPQISPVPTFAGGFQNAQQQSPCAKNLLVGCQPHAQLVPCSSSYESHPQPYSIHEYQSQPRPQPAPIYQYQQPQPAPMHQYQPQPATPYVNSPHFPSKVPVLISRFHNSRADSNAMANNQTTAAEESSIDEITENSNTETATAEDTSSATKDQTDSIKHGIHNIITDTVGWIHQLPRHKSPVPVWPPHQHKFADQERHMQERGHFKNIDQGHFAPLPNTPKRKSVDQEQENSDDSMNDNPTSSENEPAEHERTTQQSEHPEKPKNSVRDYPKFTHFAPRPFNPKRTNERNLINTLTSSFIKY